MYSQFDEDPFLAGLDFKTRPTLLSLLHSVHVSNNPRIIMGLRLQDPIPEWITHIALVQNEHVMTGEKAAILGKLNLHSQNHTHEAARSVAGVCSRDSRAGSGILVDMQNVNVRYHVRHVRWCFPSCL
jgi:ABC-type Mn2+/Zn2+ transport system ATPase subunit